MAGLEPTCLLGIAINRVFANQIEQFVSTILDQIDKPLAYLAMPRDHCVRFDSREGRDYLPVIAP